MWYEPVNSNLLILEKPATEITKENFSNNESILPANNRHYDLVQQTLDTILLEFRSGQMRACKLFLTN